MNKLYAFIRKTANYLFQVKLGPVVFFRKPLRNWRPLPARLLIRDYTYSKMTPGLVDEVFAGDPVRIRMFKLYLECGAIGHLIYNDKTWIGYTWTVDLSFREKKFGRERLFTFVSVPKEWSPPEEHAHYGFTAEVNHRYQGKGVFLYLINKSCQWLKEESGDAVLYSAVDEGNAPSLKTKLATSEEPVGVFSSMYIRLLGRHFSNVYSGRLQKEPLHTLDLEKQVHRTNGSAGVKTVQTN